MPEQTQTTELATTQKTPQTQLQRQPETFAPRTLSEAIKFAELIATSGMAPRGYEKNPAAIVVAIQMGMEVGLQPLQALQNIAVINSRPAIWGDGALALVKTHPEFEWIKEDDLEAIRKNSKAVCIIKRRNQPEVKVTFSIEDAKMAGLWGKTGPWTNYWPRMMQMRARGFAIRDAFPDALKGIITAEEAMDIPPEQVIQGAALVETAPDPAEEKISMEEATEYWHTWRDSGWKVEQAKEATQRIAGVTSSAEIKRKFYAECLKWAESKPPAEAPAQPANPDAEPCDDGNA
jgi:hypothetical protein